MKQQILQRTANVCKKYLQAAGKRKDEENEEYYQLICKSGGENH